MLAWRLPWGGWCWGWAGSGLREVGGVEWKGSRIRGAWVTGPSPLTRYKKHKKKLKCWTHTYPEDNLDQLLETQQLLLTKIAKPMSQLCALEKNSLPRSPRQQLSSVRASPSQLLLSLSGTTVLPEFKTKNIYNAETKMNI